jgi:tRNA(Arg) A34 adenosine deaminase TadA
MKFQEKMIDILMKVAETNLDKNKLACAVVHKKKVLAFGINSDKTDPFQQKYSNHTEKIHKHAEIDAIKRVCNRYGQNILRECTLYIVRLRKPYPRANFWMSGLSKPCSGCMQAIEKFKIKKVIYTTDIGVDTL